MRIDGRAAQLRFRGKRGVLHHVTVQDERLARLIGNMRELPGQDLFQSVGDDGERPGKTPSICRKCYVHPAVIDSYLDGSMLDALRALQPEAAAVVALLQQRLQHVARHG